MGKYLCSAECDSPYRFETKWTVVHPLENRISFQLEQSIQSKLFWLCWLLLCQKRLLSSIHYLLSMETTQINDVAWNRSYLSATIVCIGVKYFFLLAKVISQWPIGKCSTHVISNIRGSNSNIEGRNFSKQLEFCWIDNNWNENHNFVISFKALNFSILLFQLWRARIFREAYHSSAPLAIHFNLFYGLIDECA